MIAVQTVTAKAAPRKRPIPLTCLKILLRKKIDQKNCACDESEENPEKKNGDKSDGEKRHEYFAGY